MKYKLLFIAFCLSTAPFIWSQSSIDITQTYEEPMGGTDDTASDTTLTFTELPLATSDGTLTVTAFGDFNGNTEYVAISADSGAYSFGTFLNSNAADDEFDHDTDVGLQGGSASTASAVIAMADLNALLTDGEIAIFLDFNNTPLNGVDLDLTDPGIKFDVRLQYTSVNCSVSQVLHNIEGVVSTGITGRGQSWTAPCTAKIRAINVRTGFITGASQDVTVSIIDGDITSSNPTSLLEFDTTLVDDGNGTQLHTIALPESIDVTLSQEYSFGISYTGATMNYRGYDQNVYTGGQPKIKLNNAGWINTSNDADLYFEILTDEPPTVTCQNISVTLDANLEASITFDDVTTESSDDVGIASQTLSQTDFSCADIGDNEITVTVEDSSGQITSCTATVTVTSTETEVPTMSCPNDIVAYIDAPNTSTTVNYSTPTATDNCGDPTVTLTAGLDSGSSFPVGTTTITYQAEDINGNIATCSFDVVVVALTDDTLIVTKTEDTNDGVCDSDCSLREAIYASSNIPGDQTIEFSSLFDTEQTIALNTDDEAGFGQIEFGGPGGIGGNHKVIGPGEDLLTIDGQNGTRIFYLGFAHMTLELSDMTLANANAKANASQPYQNYGGAILNLGHAAPGGTDLYDMTLRNVTIKGSQTAFGGGMSGLRSWWLLENVTFDGNGANSWGAAFESEGGNVTMNNCAVINSEKLDQNNASDAIKPFASNFVSQDAYLTINNCTFSNNTSGRSASVILATGEGSGTNARTAQVNIYNSTITNNSSSNAAIVFNGNALIEADNSIISGNFGGASPDISGGNLLNDVIIEGNTIFSTNNLIGTGGGLTDGEDGNIVGVNDPMLLPLSDNDGTTLAHHVPIGNSPAVDAGSTDETLDQLGNTRGADGNDDIGAIEMQALEVLMVTKTEDTNDNVCDTDCSLREAVYVSNNTGGIQTIIFSSLFDTEQTIALNTDDEAGFGLIEFGGPGGIGGNHIVLGPGEDLLTIDGQSGTRIFYLGFAHLTLELSDMTLANADAQANASQPYQNYGGAILNLGHAVYSGVDQMDVTLRNVTIKNSQTAFGGGMSGLRSWWLLENVTFDGNGGSSWGAAFESEGGNVTMNNCAVINSKKLLGQNAASDAIKPFGSAFVAQDAYLTVNNCTFSNNTSDRAASVILATGQNTRTAHVYINNSTITANQSSNAAIVFNGNAQIEVDNSIISGNIGGTSPDINGGDLLNDVIIEGNTIFSTYNLIGTGGGLTDGEDGNIVGVNDPLLLPLTDNDGTTLAHHSFYTNSPAYNSGDPNNTETQDQIGNDRNYNGDGFDIGAIEIENAAIPELTPHIFLQGAAMNPNTGEESLMRDDLRVADLIPTTSPYSDGLTCADAVFDDGGTSGSGATADNIVDWVWVELRDATDNTLVVNGRSALLQRDGDVVDIDGVSSLTYFIPYDNFYVAIKHRNHLGVMCNTIVPFSGTATDVDFTDANNPITYGTNAQSTFGMPTDILGLWGGNANGDINVNYLGNSNDTNAIKDEIVNDSGNTLASNLYSFQGYMVVDINMNGTIKYLGTDNDSNVIKDIILGHEDNETSPTNLFIVEERLPEND